MNYIDLVIILIILIFMLMGSLKGFISSVIGLVEYILSIFLAYKLSPLFAKFMVDKWAVDEKISSAIHSLIPKIAENIIGNSDDYKSVLDASGQNIESVKDALSNVELPFLDVIADKIIQILAMIILFFILKFIFRILSRVLNLIARLPVLKEFNKIGGIVIGFVEGAILAVIVVLGISLWPNEDLQGELSNSFIGNKVSQVIIDVTVNSMTVENS